MYIKTYVKRITSSHQRSVQIPAQFLWQRPVAEALGAIQEQDKHILSHNLSNYFPNLQHFQTPELSLPDRSSLYLMVLTGLFLHDSGWLIFEPTYNTFYYFSKLKRSENFILFIQQNELCKWDHLFRRTIWWTSFTEVEARLASGEGGVKRQCCRSVPQGMKRGAGNGGVHSSAPEWSSASHCGRFQGPFS